MKQQLDDTIGRIIVGLDGSSGSARALAWTIRVARSTDAEVVAVYAWVHSPYVAGLPALRDSQASRRQAREIFERDWCAPLRDAGLHFRTVFVDGNPVSVLVKIGLQERAEMIVVGARGLGGFAELLLGGVSRQLTHHAPVPVVVPSPLKELSPEKKEAYIAAARRVSFSDI